MNLLIVDDTPISLKLLRAQLEAEGHAVFEAHDGVDALALLERQPVDAVISDILMPRMDGYRLCYEIRKHARLHDLPIILCTSTYTSPGDEKLVLDVGADKYLKKPVSLETLVAALREVIAMPHAAPQPKALQEIEVFKEYSERLVSKLEEKNTELRAQTEVLRESEDQFRAIFDLASVGIAQADPRTGRWLRVNKKMCEITGYSAGELLQLHVLDITYSEDRQSDREAFERVVRGESPDYRMEKRYIRKDGALIWVNVNMTVIRDAAGQPTRTVAAIEDITERRKLEDQFRQSQKMEAVGQLAGGVAHDFNNILAIIQMQIGLLNSDGDLSTTQLEYANGIGDAAKRAAALTQQLLLFSRKGTVKLQDLDLNQSINNVSKMLRRTISENNEIQFKLALQPPLIRADPIMVDQVLINLAVNARDAMPKGGRLFVETSAVEFNESDVSPVNQVRPGSFACLCVSDTGCGIPPEILPRIFEPFFTTKDIGKGTGLGLATVFGIVEQHKGWIHVYSEVGHGTTFRIYFPRLAGTSPQKPDQSTLTSMRGGNETILLVEDEMFLRAPISKALSRLGYRVLEASNGVEALEVWKQHRDEIRLVLTDLVMPGGMSGRDLASRLLKENPKLKVIYASGYTTEVAGKDFLLEEGVNFLSKPFQVRKLAQTVRDRLDEEIAKKLA
jgi:PAS domain S-box-containing protein